MLRSRPSSSASPRWAKRGSAKPACTAFVTASSISERLGAGEPMQPRSLPPRLRVTNGGAPRRQRRRQAGVEVQRGHAPALPRGRGERRHAGGEEQRAVRLLKSGRGGVFEGEGAIADDARGVRPDVGRGGEVQPAHSEVPFGCYGERAHDRQIAASPPAFERVGVERLDPAGGVAVDVLCAGAVEEVRQIGRDRDRRLRPAPDETQGLRDLGAGRRRRRGSAGSRTAPATSPAASPGAFPANARRRMGGRRLRRRSPPRGARGDRGRLSPRRAGCSTRRPDGSRGPGRRRGAPGR